jgi:hypothetical protein
MYEKIFKKKSMGKPGFFIALPDFLREARGKRQKTFSGSFRKFSLKKTGRFFFKKKYEIFFRK